jgi:putative transcriptional regulator
MSELRCIRDQLGLSQEELGVVLGGVTQGSISHYETGRRPFPPDLAVRLVGLAKGRGVAVSLERIYGLSIPADNAAGVHCE